MATLPPTPGPMSASEPHRARQIAESFGTDPARYDRTRPRYPDVLVERIIAESPGTDVLDVGSGTGVSARPFEAAGCRVLGVEVDPRMADYARRTGLEIEAATFEDWDPAGRSFDAVIAGQAWHWVDPIAGAAKAAAVLRSGGRIALFWNAFQFPPGLAADFAAVNRRVLPDSPFSGGETSGGVAAYSAFLARAADGIRHTGAFGEPEQWHYDWERPYTRDEWLDMVPTAGAYTQLTADTTRELLTGIGAAIDAAGGSFTVNYTAVALTAARTSRCSPPRLPHAS